MDAFKQIVVWMMLASTIGCQRPGPVQQSLEHNTDRKTSTSETTAAAAPVAPLELPSGFPAQSKNLLRSKNEPVETEHQMSLDELLLFFPTKFPDGNWNPDNLRFEEVWMTSEDGTQIHGWYCPCENPQAYVLYAHGNAGNLSHRSGLLVRLQNQLQVASLIFDYRGYGRSEGRPTVSGAIADTQAASKFLANHVGVDESEIVLMGRSLGAAIVIQVASETQPRGLVVESTFSSLKQIASHHYPKLAWLVPKTKLDSGTAIASYNGRLLQSHGTHDQTIPIQLGRELFDAANDPKSFIKIQHADHNDEMPGHYYDSLNEFFDNLPRQRE